MQYNGGVFLGLVARDAALGAADFAMSCYRHRATQPDIVRLYPGRAFDVAIAERNPGLTMSGHPAGTDMTTL
jgi:hypothetical protein